MGSGRWDASTYATTSRRAFSYDSGLRSKPRSQWKVHPDLDPAGVTIRESRDSVEHPTSNAIAVLFDITGSMHRFPREVQAALPDLHQHLLQTNAVPDPQILFGSIGDAVWDRCPLQVGQFESDNRMDDHLGNIVLERGGGDGQQESYELAFYFLARHTSIDCFDKRGEKGIAFIFGDEKCYPEVKAAEVASIIDDGMQVNIPVDDIIAEAQKQWDIYFIIPAGTVNADNPLISGFWRNKLGADHVLHLDSAENTCQLIGETIVKAKTTNLLPSLKAMITP